MAGYRIVDRRNQGRGWFAAAALAVALTGAAHAGVSRRLRLPSGGEPVTVRGVRDHHTLRAGAGQTPAARVTSPRHTAVIRVTAQGRRFLPGAGDGQDATRRRGRLPAAGGYAFAVARCPRTHGGLDGGRRYPSPDGALCAVVHSNPPRGGGDAESVVSIQTARGRTLASRDYSSPDGSHGHGVARALWTADSRFFVFSLVSSGGHSPWHSPTHFFSRKRHRFYGLDDFVPGRAVASPAFRVSRPATIRVLGRGGRPVRVDLRRLEARLTPGAARSEYDSY